MRVFLDRIEEDVAIVLTEDGTAYNLPKNLVPAEAKEEDIILIGVDKEGSIDRQEELNSILEEVWHDRGDIDNM